MKVAKVFIVPRAYFIGTAAVFLFSGVLLGQSVENEPSHSGSPTVKGRLVLTPEEVHRHASRSLSQDEPSASPQTSEGLSGSAGGTMTGAERPAAVITVRSSAASGGTCPGATCTLRQAIAVASSGDTINFDMTTVTSPITPGFPEIAINKNLTIQGPGAGQLTLQSTSTSGPRMFNIAAGFTLNLSGVTLSGFSPNVFAGNGGAILNAGTLNVSGVVFTGNKTKSGGVGAAIRNSGTLNVTDSVFSGNSTEGGGSGGAIYNSSTGILDVDRTAFMNNAAQGDGGAITNDGTMEVTNSSFINNSLVVSNGFEGGGGAIYHFPDNTVVITNCTFAGNTVSGTFEAPPNGLPGGGGAIVNAHNGIIEITHSTISGNSMTATNGNGGGVGNLRFHGSTGQVRLKNTIAAGNTATPATGKDVFGAFTSQGFNFVGRSDGSTGIANGVTNDQAGTNAAPINPQLSAVTNNGGPTSTMAPQPGSPVIDAGNSFGIGTDQRGLPKPVDSPGAANGAGDLADIGAFEVQNSVAAQLAFSVQPSNVFAGAPISAEVQVRDAAGGVVNSNAPVTIAIANNPGGATLNGTTTVQAVNGVATFSNLSINTVGNGYTLIASTTGLSSATSNPFNVTSGPDLAIAKTHTGNFQQSQAGAQYTITVTNAGAVATSGTVTVTDTLPAGLTATAISGTGWTCTLAPLSCTRGDTLAPAGSYPAITLTVTVAGNAPSSLTNTATVSGGGQFLTGNDTATDTTTITTCTAPIVVTTNANTGPGSLRQAITDICWGGTISFGGGVASPIVLSSQLSVAKVVTIQGPGANALTISGNDQVRIFDVPAIGNMTLSGVTLDRGRRPFAQFSENGGAIQNAGTINLNNVALTGNVASGGGGGALSNSGTATVTNSTFSANTSAVGGAIDNGPGGVLNLTNCTLSGNTAFGNITIGQAAIGGGIRNFLGTANITACTITNNGASGGGGGISTSNGTVNLKNTIIAKNSSNQDVSGTFVTQGYNLIGSGTGGTGVTNNVNGDQVGTSGSPLDPLLAALANNGGPTQTHLPQAGSPAIDKGKSFGLFTDQRGLPRPVDDLAIANASGGDAADIGAVELQNGVQPPARISGVVTYGTTAAGQPVKFVPGVLLSAAGTPTANATTDSAGAYILTGLGSGAYTVTPTKTGDVNGSISGLDAARVAQHVAGLITLTPNQQIAGDATNNGSLSGLDAARIAQFAAGLTNPGIAGQWKFIPPSRTYPSLNVSQTNQNYEAILVGEVTGNWTPAASRPDDTAGSDADAPEGGEQAKSASAALEKGITLPVSVGDTTNRGIVAYDFTLTFDPTKYRPSELPADPAGTLSDGWMVVQNTHVPGTLRVIAFGTTALIGDGVLLNLHFDVLNKTKARAAEFQWDSFLLNEDDISSRALTSFLVERDASASTCITAGTACN